MNLTKQNWPLGYTPSVDPVNGDPNGLIRMDNCYLDEQGVLSLCRGIELLTDTLGDFPYKLYAKNINQTSETIWAALGLPSINVVRSASGKFNDTVTIISNGDQAACFGDCLGEVLAFAGSARVKDNGSTFANLGLATPSAPTLQPVNQVILNLTGTFSEIQGGTVNSTSNVDINLQTTSSNCTAIVRMLLNSITDTTLVGAAQAQDPSLDTIQFNLTTDDPSQITSVIIEFYMGNATPPPGHRGVINAYTFSFDPTQLLQGPNQQTSIQIKRGDFTRLGNDTTVDWHEISEIHITVTSNTQQNNLILGSIAIYGGVQGQINGNYSYIQVNVSNNGFYQAKSPASAPTNQDSILNGSVILTPSAAPGGDNITEVWFFRLGGVLNQYLFVGTTPPGTPFTDNLSDTEVQEINIVLNQFLLTLQKSSTSSLIDDIFSVEGLFYDRMLYMTINAVYVSDRLNPDAVDTRFTVKAFGDPTEKNLWIKKLTNNVCILGTNKNLYELIGTFELLPDGSVDVNVNPIGENHPPLSGDVCSSQGQIFYMAADGPRFTIGSNSQPVAPAQLRLLVQGQTRADVPPIAISPAAIYPMAVGKTRFYISMPHVDGTIRLYAYDLINKYWRFQFTDPVSIFQTPTDRVLVGYNKIPTIEQASVAVLDTGPGGFTDQNGTLLGGFPLEIRTVYDSNGQPRNRKDTFTLKLIVDTGGVGCSVYIAKDQENDPYTFVGTFNTNGLATVYFPLNTFTLGFRYSIRIVDNGQVVNGIFFSSMTSFKLYEMTIEYNPRPEQLDYLLIPPDNLGTISRKRIVNYAFVIDTLGNNITFTPLIDNSNSGILPSSRTLSTPTKQTYIYYFTEEQIGTDVNGILSGGVFEFYGVNSQEIISEKMPVPCEYLVIPNNDYGIPNRKRHSSYKFQINTRGQNVTFTPKLDGVLGTPTIFNTTEKRIVEYFFTSDTIARDIGGILQSAGDTPFEFYGVIVPQVIEQLPPRLTYYRIPNSNLGASARKRLRTIPMVIDTYGQNVVFNPIVDGVNPGDTPATFNTTGKTTVWYYFDKDSFGVDYGGELISQTTTPFEFYNFGEIQNVETLPVGKIFDQVGPIRFDKIAKLFSIRLRMIATDTNPMNITIYGDASPTVPQNSTLLYQTTLSPVVNTDFVYQIDLPKNVNSDIMRLTLGPVVQPFFRYDMTFKVSTSGMESDSQWIPVK